MERIKFITALNQDIWRNYAHRTTESWQTPPEIWWEERPRSDLDLWQAWREHHREHRAEPDFEHTWQRFSHKVEAQISALSLYRMSPDWQYLIWLDADVVQQKNYTERDLTQWLPRQGDLCAYLGRGPNYHPETGFIAYDLHSPDLDRFLVHLRGEYLGDRLFDLDQWHDAYVWDWVCRREQIPRTDIGPGRPGEAFGRSPLRQHFLHLKGRRKTNIHTGQTAEELMYNPRM